MRLNVKEIAELPEDLKPYTEEIHHLIRVSLVPLLPDIEDGRKAKENPLNANFDKKSSSSFGVKLTARLSIRWTLIQTSLLKNA